MAINTRGELAEFAASLEDLVQKLTTVLPMHREPSRRRRWWLRARLGRPAPAR